MADRCRVGAVETGYFVQKQVQMDSNSEGLRLHSDGPGEQRVARRGRGQSSRTGPNSSVEPEVLHGPRNTTSWLRSRWMWYGSPRSSTVDEQQRGRAAGRKARKGDPTGQE